MRVNRKSWKVAGWAGLGVLLCAATQAGVTSQVANLIRAAVECPAVVSLQQCRVTIAKVQFVTKLEGGSVTMKENDPDKFRFAVVTLKIDKPAGQTLVLPAADLALHYKRDGGEYDVAPCEAMSAFSVSPDEDRKLDAHNSSGPGWVKSKTGASASRAQSIYVDAVFAKLEEDVTQMWVCVAQPGNPAPFASKGW